MFMDRTNVRLIVSGIAQLDEMDFKRHNRFVHIFIRAHAIYDAFVLIEH